MSKKIIRLTESELKRYIRKVISEQGSMDMGGFKEGPGDPKLVANNVVKYALSLKGTPTQFNEQGSIDPTSYESNTN